MFGIASGQFIGQNVHFAINLFVALACFTAGWLYFDAWSGRHKFADAAKWAGFFVLAVGLLLAGAAWNNSEVVSSLANLLKLLGYVGLIIGNALDPIQPRPKADDFIDKPEPPKPKPAIPAAAPPSPATTTPATPPAATAPATPPPQAATANPTPVPTVTNPAAFALPGPLVAGISGALPLGALIVAGLLWRRATVGLERHIKPLAYTFAALTLADGLGLTSLWQNTDNPLLQSIIKPLGPLWILQHLILLGAGVMLINWVWRYLTKRLLTQIFLMTTSLTVTIVLVATVSITSLLLSSLEKASLASLETAAKVLRYAIDSKTSETRADAEVLAQNPATATAVTTHDHTALAQLANTLLVQKQLSDVIIVGDSGQVLIRASDPERYGDSLSDDSLVRRALTGTTASSLASTSGVLSPQIIITTASPIRISGQIAGATLSSLALDNAFVDGIKHTTGLDSTVYSGPTRTATTLVGPDGTSRSIGVKETHQAILTTTLKNGQIWHGSLDVSNQSFLAIYLPLKDVDNTLVGMLFVGQPQNQILQTAQESVNLTFISAVAWLIIIMLPIYYMSKKIAGQLR